MTKYKFTLYFNYIYKTKRKVSVLFNVRLVYFKDLLGYGLYTI